MESNTIVENTCKGLKTPCSIKMVATTSIVIVILIIFIIMYQALCCEL